MKQEKNNIYKKIKVKNVKCKKLKIKFRLNVSSDHPIISTYICIQELQWS